MKKLVTLIALMMSAGLLASPNLTQVPTTHAFAPMGFDTNDNAEVIVTGFLPNLCYKAPQSSVKMAGNSIAVEVKALNYSSENTYCLEMLVPFTEVVDLGVLDKGTYTIDVNPEKSNAMFNKGVSTTLKIVEASSDAVDDFIYASVKSIDMDNDDVVLKGYNPSDCLVLDEVKYVDNGIDTYSVLPMMKKVSEFCPMKPTPFEYRTKLPDTLKVNNILLHVRVMDGKSVNRVISTDFDF